LISRLLATGVLAALAISAGADEEAGPGRIVTLAPHLAEIVFAAGGGDRLVGVTAYTDYPPAAADLPRIGDAFRVDMERLSVLDPDLVLAWADGTPAALVARLRERGYPVVTVRTRSLEDIARAIEGVGERLGTMSEADRAAEAFRSELAAVVSGRDAGRPLRVFYQVAGQPLYTINGGHFISELIRLCGGRNIFDDLDDLAPVVTVESVLTRDPELILAAGSEAAALDRWRRWDSLSAVRADNLRRLPADTLARPSPRLVRGAADLCDAIEASRRRLPAGAAPRSD
jgi:iron complex transport system substrate-binding protein